MFSLRPAARGLIANRFIYFNLLDLKNGSPYFEPPFSVIAWELPLRVSGIDREGFAITGSRIMMQILYLDPDLPGDDIRVWRTCVWNWKTGDLVRVMRLQGSQFIHLTSQGTRPFD
jgi:hypothetical protein